MRKLQLVFIIFFVLLIPTPFLYLIYWISKAGELPLNDYWGIISQFYSVDGLSTNLLDWLVRSNEHFVLIPSLVYAINILVTKGSNLGLSLAALSFACIQSLLLVALLPLSLKDSRLVWLFLLLCVSSFSFTPAAMHNWMRGFSGVAWVGTNMFVVASIFCLTKLAHSKQVNWAIASIFLGVFGYLTYSTSIALWPVLCAVVILMRLRLQLVLMYVSFAVLICCAFLLTYKTPAHHPSLTNISVSDVFIYIPIYLGAIFTSQVNVALNLGIIGLLLAAGFASYWLSLKMSLAKVIWLPWLVIQTYVVLTAVMAAVSRSGFGTTQAMASRYASLPSLFWLSLAVVVVTWMHRLLVNSKQHWLLLTPVVAAITALILSMYKVGFAAAQPLAVKASFQPLVALSLQLGASDSNLIKEVITPKPHKFLTVRDALKANGLVPFNRDIKHNNFCAALDQKINSNLLIPTSQYTAPGFFDRVTKLTTEVAKVEGWFNNSEGNTKCIAIVNQDNSVRGFAMIGFQRLDLAKSLGSAYEFFGWEGYVQMLPTDKWLTAYAVTFNSKKWIGLNNSHLVND